MNSFRKYKIYGIVVALIAVALTSCNDDDDIAMESSSPSYNSEIVGEWAWIGDNGEYTLINLDDNHTVKGETYVSMPEGNKSVSLSGIWYYYASGGVLRIRGNVDNSLHYHDINYQLKKSGKNSMLFVNQEVHSEQLFLRVKQSMEIYVGDFLEINDGEIKNAESIIDVTTGEAKAPGICFIEYGTDGDVCRVNVLHRVEKYMNLISDNIDDVLKAMGSPDVQGTVGNNQAVLYRQSLNVDYISAVQIHFDDSTREVTKILVQYKDTDALLEDYLYFLEEYKQDGDVFYKGIWSSYLEAECAASPFISGDTGYCSYMNIEYYLTHGYY